MLLLVTKAADADEIANHRDPPAREPSTMTNIEIDAHNRGLAFTHPRFIKCRRIQETSSLVRKNRICRTNDDWKKAWVAGNQDARDTMETLARGWSNSFEPPEQGMPQVNQPQ